MTGALSLPDDRENRSDDHHQLLDDLLHDLYLTDQLQEQTATVLALLLPQAFLSSLRLLELHLITTYTPEALFPHTGLPSPARVIVEEPHPQPRGALLSPSRRKRRAGPAPKAVVSLGQWYCSCSLYFKLFLQTEPITTRPDPVPLRFGGGFSDPAPYCEHLLAVYLAHIHPFLLAKGATIVPLPLDKWIRLLSEVF